MDSASQNTQPAPPSTPGAEIYTVRTAHRPHIVCPPWCAVAEDDHADQLVTFDGGVLHAGEWVSMTADDSFALQLSATQLVDGTPDPDDPEILIRLSLAREDGYTLGETRTLAARLAGYSSDPSLSR